MFDNIALCFIVLLLLSQTQTKKTQTPVQQWVVSIQQPPPFLEHALSSTCKFAFLFSKTSSKNLEMEGDPSSTTFLTDFALAIWRSKFFIRTKITKRTRICFILVAAISMEEIFLDLKCIIVHIKIHNRYISGKYLFPFTLILIYDNYLYSLNVLSKYESVL